MRVVITGATGNVGTSVVDSLVDEPSVDEVVGIARRLPELIRPKVRWICADVASRDLVPLFRGADAVVHLAWAIQPSHDEAELERTNLMGSERVFAAVAEAGVRALVYASSVGAYSAGPKTRRVDESWPAGGIASSTYSRHKAAVERRLDAFEAEAPGVRVVRMRPALIFKAGAASEIRRLFAGPFLPNVLVRRNLIKLIPRIPGLRFQVVHSSDVGEAYRQAVVRDVSGPFNIASEPIVGTAELCSLFDARPIDVSAGLVRRLAALSWRLHLQPTGPGWVDMALGSPLLDTAKARTELGWTPSRTSLETIAELVDGIRHAAGLPTPPLSRTTGGPARLGELRTGIGQRQ